MTMQPTAAQRMIAARALAPGLALLATVLLTTGCLVDDRYCVLRDDCPQGQICNTLSNSCQLEECRQDSDCWTKGFPNGKGCIAGRCEFPLTTGKRVAAPAFCLDVANPKSPYYGQSRCLADEKGKVVLVFFALLA